MERVEIGDAVLFCGDCREVLPTLTGVDVCFTDPPFSKQVHDGARGKGASTGGSHVLVDFASIDAAEFISVCGLMVDATARWVVMTCDWRHAVSAQEAGLPLVRLGVWTKADPAPQFSGDRPGTGWEAVMILHRPGKKRWNGGGKPAVWRTQIVKNEALHPTQKPLELVGEWVKQFSDPGETALDPFMGSGTTGVACAKMGRRFIGIERERRYFDIACRRIEEAYKQADLFVPAPASKPVQQALFGGGGA